MANRRPAQTAATRAPARREADADLRRFIAGAPAMVMALDARGRVIEWNRESRRVSGYGLADLTGDSWKKLFPDAAARRAFSAQRRDRLGTNFRDWTWPIVTARGQSRHIAWTAGPGRAPHPDAVTWAVGRDVTDLHRAREAALRADEFLSVGQQTVGFGAWSWDPATNEVAHTPELEDIFRVPRGTFGRRYADFSSRVHPDDLKDFERARDRAIAAGAPFDYEFRIVDNDGGVRWINAKGYGLHDADGKLRKVVGIDTDVSARKQVEAELAFAHRRAQQFAAHMRDTVEQERMAISRDVHDQIGAILTAIRMRLASLAGKTANEHVGLRAELLGIAALTESAMHATRDICSRLRPPSLEDIGLAETCRWYLAEWARASRVRAIGRFPRKRCECDPQVSTDLFRVLQELLTNVARHSRASRVNVGLSCGRTFLRLRVQDDGRGFEPGVATEGFGLTGVRERVRHHGGQVGIQSGPDGTTVEISIPLQANP